MLHLQQQFLQFHDNIKLTMEDNEELRNKRDIIVKRIKENIPDAAKPFTIFTQGSYAMFTGIQPLDNDYDIDVGLYFEMSKDDVKPVDAKKWVLDAIDGHTKDVRMKTPCVTATYAAGYHVDVTVYAAENSDGKVYLAKGKPSSNEENKTWDESNPKDLIQVISTHLSNADDRKQFRRIVRYLKRWKDVQFSGVVNGKPSGIALTACAYHYLTIQKVVVDLFTGKTEYRDLDALISLISSLLGRFYTVVEYEGDELVTYERLSVTLPVSPYPDLFIKMTNKQMVTFKEKLESLKKALEDARAKEDPTDAAELLQKHFGSSFPVPPRPDTGKKAFKKAVVPSNESA
ncbi:nucleotidyltransferase [Brevibacillus agri]|uniref:nucleotidyltransferase domain-containing protein n=1 Tax=Brevibacillus TaxID=55080 RepID=UPI00204171A0|nr:nucleotidyltransferase [Brevibacillus agri]MCM3082077.1 nucleotidyltransferase [Brevibacillus invocatus]MCM3432488.1 nucleotidyltransferase [Brevibacillus invocatus]MED1645743.1 nucleotidyltransferase [Brevibacillus agri]MED1652752.1 nucleotidyltransferase [Brevibacillus agri]MED1689552.1 nucleotidyltransferase [Brevibacillus agri]